MQLDQKEIEVQVQVKNIKTKLLNNS